MNYILLFHAIFFIVFKTNFSHEKPKHEFQRNFQLLQLQNLLYNCRSGVCFLRASIVLQGLKYPWILHLDTNIMFACTPTCQNIP